MEQRKNTTFKGYPSVNEALAEKCKLDWGCNQEEAINAALLHFINSNEEISNAAVSAYRAASTRAIRTGHSITDEFKHATALFAQQLAAGNRKPGLISDAIRDNKGKGPDRRAEGQ